MKLSPLLATTLLSIAIAPLARAEGPPPTGRRLQPLRPTPALQGLRPNGQFKVIVHIDRITPRPGELSRFELTRVGKVLFDRKVLSTVADALNTRVRLFRDVSIIAKPCGVANAFYDPSNYSITMCDELFATLEVVFSHMGEGPAFDDAVLGATSFFLLHEAGHALVHQLDIPLLAREEDAVDGLATYLLMTSNAHGIALSGASSFAFMGARRKPGSPLAFWDEHSLHEQRFYNITCWIYGSNPGLFGFLVQQGLLPQDRAKRCPAEHAQLQAGAAKLLAAHFR